MLRNLKDLFDQLTTHLTAPASAQAPAEQEHTLQLATAVLLVEVMRAEPDLKDDERDAVLTALRRKFNLSDDELQARLAQSSRAMCRGWVPSTRATLSRTASKGSAKCSAARCTPQRRSASSQLSRAS